MKQSQFAFEFMKLSNPGFFGVGKNMLLIFQGVIFQQISGLQQNIGVHLAVAIALFRKHILLNMWSLG